MSKSNQFIQNKRGFLPHRLLPVLAGVVSLLAVLNAAPGESLWRYAGAHSLWLFVGICSLFAFGALSSEDYIKWCPFVGSVGLVVMYVSVFASSFFYYGQPGTLTIAQSFGVFAVPWELLAPVYICWLIRFSPGRMSMGNVAWGKFGLFIALAALWWIPLLVVPSLSGFISFFLLFLLISWLDNVEPAKLVTALGSGVGLAAVAFYAASVTHTRTAVLFSSTDHGLLATAFGNGGLFGGGAGGAFNINYFLPPSASATIFLSSVETIGLIGTLAIFVLGSFMVAWGLRNAKSNAGTDGLLIQLFVAYLAIRTVLFFWAVTGLVPKADFSAPLFNSSGCDLIAVMFILKETLLPRGKPLNMR